MLLYFRTLSWRGCQRGVISLASDTPCWTSLTAGDLEDPFVFFFFFQAEDGIRDHCVTGVQTCALPICMHFHRDVLAMCDLFPRHVIRPGPDDIFCGTPPLAFTFGLGGLLCFPLRVGASTDRKSVV